MSSMAIIQNILWASSEAPRCCQKNQFVAAISHSQFLSSSSVKHLKKKQTVSSAVRINKQRNLIFQAKPSIFAVQSNFVKVIQTVWKVGKDGIEAGTNLVPDSVPRPIARISVAVVAVTLTLFVLKSLISTAFFVLAMMGLIYFTYIALNKDEGPRSGGGTTSVEDSLEEARKIMDKYK